MIGDFDKYICEMCGKEFVYLKSFQKHMKLHESKKTKSEILSMKYWTRNRWYEIISPEEKEEAMRIVETARRIKHSEFMSGENNPMKRSEVRAKFVGENNPMYGVSRTEEFKINHSALMIEKWKDPEYKDKHTGKNNSMYGRTGDKNPMYGRTGEKNPMYGRTGRDAPSYIDGRKSDPQYDRRRRLRQIGLSDEFVELTLYEKRNRTDIELAMEYWLINNGISYEFQKYINLPSTHTKVDFFVEPNVCLYCDGNRWHETEERRISDEKITKELEELGYRVIRVWGSDIRGGIRPWEILEVPRVEYEQHLLKVEKIVRRY